MTLIRIELAAKVLHVPESTLRRWISEGRLKVHGPKPRKVDYDEVEQVRDTLRDLDKRP